jgi:hypothetical protein
MRAAPIDLVDNPVPPPWGKPLTGDDYAALEKSWITRAIADAAMLRRVEDYEGREIVGQKRRNCAGILISYYWPGDASAFNHRLRRDNPDWTQGKNGKPKQDRKYLSPPNGGNRIYIPPGVTPEQLADSKIPIALVEGEKKALALWRLANYETDRPRFIPIAIAGVWNWRGRVGKTGGPNGERLDVTGPIGDLSRIEWKARKVFIVFDSNVQTNDSVKWARKGIARELARRSAKVDFVNLPENCGVNGIDDLLAVWGPDKVLELFDSSVSGARLDVVLPPQFQSKPEGMFRTSGREQLSQVQLTNYQATIAANIRLDDGIETKREFEIESELMGQKFRFIVAASEFAGMEWAIEQMGANAITYPNQREYARTAIQSLSFAAEERSIYTHTGWRKIDGHWLYLHTGGAVGWAEALSRVDVRLPGPMSRYELRLSSGPEARISAIRASLRLLVLGPPEISFPLLAATYRAVLGDADFSIHLAGESGAFKSEIAALHQQHFGADMKRLNLPGTWSSTGNALEVLTFHAKDALFVVDDFAPQGSGADVARYHAAADRVFRAAGNHSGRNRLDSTAKLRGPKPPRALIFSTGEDIPRGQSIRARLLILELPKNRIEASRLTERQTEAQAGLYSEAMGGFVQWLAPRYEEMRAWLGEKVAKCRARALRNPSHARTPDIIANLQAGFELFLDFAVEAGAVDSAEKEDLANRCWNALSCAAAAQAKHQAATEPTERFLALLRSLFTSGRAHLEARVGGAPDPSPGSCGWKRETDNWTPRGDCIGWTDGDDIYLEPTAAYRVVQIAGRDIGDALTVSEQTLRKRLHEKGLLASIDEKRETLTVRRSICGSSKIVLHFRRGTILPQVSDGDEDAE